MRFETDILTYDPSIHVHGLDRQRNKTACTSEIEKAGWIIPRVNNKSEIVLVFSTARVAGASTCRVVDLRYAGKVSLKIAAPFEWISWGVGYYIFPDGTRIACQDQLWWWPEIVKLRSRTCSK